VWKENIWSRNFAFLSNEIFVTHKKRGCDWKCVTVKKFFLQTCESFSFTSTSKHAHASQPSPHWCCRASLSLSLQLVNLVWHFHFVLDLSSCDISVGCVVRLCWSSSEKLLLDKANRQSANAWDLCWLWIHELQHCHLCRGTNQRCVCEHDKSSSSALLSFGFDNFERKDLI